MQITTQRLAEFKDLYRARFGVELCQGEALESASQFLRLVEIVSKNENENVCKIS